MTKSQNCALKFSYNKLIEKGRLRIFTLKLFSNKKVVEPNEDSNFSEFKNNQPVEIPLFRTEEGRYLATCKLMTRISWESFLF